MKEELNLRVGLFVSCEVFDSGTSALLLKTSPPRDVIGSVVEFDCVAAKTIDKGVVVVGTVLAFSSTKGWPSGEVDGVEAIITGRVIEKTQSSSTRSYSFSMLSSDSFSSSAKIGKEAYYSQEFEI